MLPVLRGRNQNQRQDLMRSDSDFDLLSPLGFASPWQMMRRMQEDMDRVFGQFMDPGVTFAQPSIAGRALQAWAPHIDVSETDQEFFIEADLPGVRQEDIDIQVQEGLLTLRAKMQQEEQPQGAQSQGTQSQGTQQGTQAQGTREHTPRNHDGQGQTGQIQNAQNQSVQRADQTGQTPRRYYQRERRFGYFERTMSLPANVDEERIRAEFKDGVLTLHIPKQPQAQQGRRISIQNGQQDGRQANATQTSGQPQATQGAANSQQTPTAAGAKSKS